MMGQDAQASAPATDGLGGGDRADDGRDEEAPFKGNRRVSFDPLPTTVGTMYDDGDMSASADDFYENGPPPPCYAIGVPVGRAADDEEASGSCSRVDGLSFSTVSEASLPSEAAAPPPAPVDAVPSSFHDPTAPSGGKVALRSVRRRRRDEQATASLTGLTRSTKATNHKPTTATRTSPKLHKSIVRSKIAFFSSLLAIALLSCGLLYTWLRNTETTFAKDQFQSIAARAIQDSADVVSRKRLSMATMATVISEQFASGEDWPNVAVEGYARIVDMLARTGSHTNMGFAPIVQASEQSAFESFAYSYFASRPEFPPETGINSPDWKGIWRIQNGTRVHDNDESTMERGFLTPIFQCCIDNPGDKVLLYNLHSEPSRRKTIDDIIKCTKDVQAHERSSIFVTDGTAEVQPSHPDYACGSMTEFVKIVRFRTRGPASIMFQPVFPADEPWEVRGLVLSPMAWDEVFESVFNSNMNGVHAVLESEREVFTYNIANGRVESFQRGDIHQTEFDEYGVGTNLTWSDLHEMGAPMYKLSLYPTDEFFKSYSTSNPTNATILALSIIVFITVLFLLYDYFVRREFMERNQLLEAKRRFIRYVSHEVRTPLNAVLMGLNVIEADLEPNSESQDLLQEIQHNAESAAEVLNDVLLYDKIEGTLALNVSMVPIWQVVERAIAEFRTPALRRDVQLRATYETSTTDGDCAYDIGMRVSDARSLPDDVRSLRVAGDASRIAQVLRNLLSNALKFTSERGIIIVTASYHVKSMADERRVRWEGTSSAEERIELHNGDEVLASPRGHFQLTVQDSGVGMTRDQLDKLFGEGVQFNPHELQAGKGAGLGLFIAKGLAEQHKGTLEATSEGLDNGSKFTLKLPLYHVPGLASEEDHSVAKKESSTRDEPSLSEMGLRLLVVDDSRSNRTLLCRLLERQGHKCDMAENGQEALELVREQMWTGDDPYDCILMDYEMPQMNGPTAAGLIRELGSDVFIVGITGNVLGEDVRYFKSRGANAVLTKPVQLSLLDELFMEHQLTY